MKAHYRSTTSRAALPRKYWIDFSVERPRTFIALITVGFSAFPESTSNAMLPPQLPSNSVILHCKTTLFPQR